MSKQTSPKAPTSTSRAKPKKADSKSSAARKKPGQSSASAKILKLLQRPQGATIVQLTSATGWQAHSVRAALTGLRKAGHKVERSKSLVGTTIYHTASSDAG